MTKKIEAALISVFHKEGLEPLAKQLQKMGTTVYSTGGTKTYLEGLGLEVVAVETITSYPSVFGGRVKTLHPAVFGGILNRRAVEGDQKEKAAHNIPDIDLVVVDLYPFEQTVAQGGSESEVIEKIDIGGISLIRAAAKNFQDVACISHQGQYDQVTEWLKEEEGSLSLEQRRQLAAEAFAISSHYDTHIFNYMNQRVGHQAMRLSVNDAQTLRYGENPHQQGSFYGDLSQIMEQLHGKELSYNNLVDAEACIQGMADVNRLAGKSKINCIIVKHTNACGWAYGDSAHDAYTRALAGDPTSAFGGIIGINTVVDVAMAEELDSLFFELLIAPDFEPKALEILKSKKNRRLLKLKQYPQSKLQYRGLLDGVLVQDWDVAVDSKEELKPTTELKPSTEQNEDLLFASLVAKHSKSNTIVLIKNGQMIGSGVGQTSRIDACKQAIEKSEKFGFEVNGSVMASDAFFPFPDCVELAGKAGVIAITQPGGSIKDELSIAKANELGIAMVMTGRRHFKH